MGEKAPTHVQARSRPTLRLGATSYLAPGGWADNVEAVQALVSDVELLFFEAERDGDLPADDECARLLRLKQAAGLTYSVHTPLAASLASEDTARRAASVELVRRAMRGAAGLSPELFVLHVYHGDCEHDPRPPCDHAAFRARAAASLGALIDSGVAAERLCVEVLDYDFAILEPVVRELGLSVALDVGHLERDGVALAPVLERLLPRTRIVQWHGTDAAGRDHRSLRHYPRMQARRLLETLLAHGYDGVLTLEVFARQELDESLALTRTWLAELGAAPAAPEVSS